jgi:uncharacterized protein (TIGR02145 family)
MKLSSYILILGSLIVFFIRCEKEAEKPPEPVTDIDGNTYKTVRIGTQIWMAENLKTTKFNNGTDITLVTDSVAWRNLTKPAYCLYNKNDTAYKRIYGILYNGYVTDSGKVCPTGWHVPENVEWHLLSDFLSDSIYGGGKLKETGTTHWKTPNRGATNTSGFSALPAGIRYFEGSFTAILYYTAFWSATASGNDEEGYTSLYFGDAKVKTGYLSKKHGLSIRCIKD